ncbi:hypothetical protein K3G63_17480 [Hymenobacter sp. HSC-4F20]|uniref:hypothetical protein n=1 Tax=Hymenobacter sp. HSC-4F20 TaxID=2864135 RepID=UPI001C737F1E|nr:hypothetical protein [Hymenobacter sp. HSC-4F20]MBX0292243.1 hypothetical protein [Hymenobacter sp. HSC-4F20]
MRQRNLLLTLALIGCVLLSGFRLEAVNLPSHNIAKQPGYIEVLDSITKNYLTKNIPQHNRMWNLHKILTSRLKKSGVDTVLFYQSGCVGCEYLPALDELGKPKKSCLCSEEEQVVYLFWRDKGKTLSKNLDCCQNQPVATGRPSVINFYFQNKTHFQAGEKFFQDFEAYNRTHPKNIKFLPPTSIHDDVTHIQFYLGNKTVKFQVRQEEFTSSGEPRHLRYTWKRKQWEWADLIKKSVATK